MGDKPFDEGVMLNDNIGHVPFSHKWYPAVIGTHDPRHNANCSSAMDNVASQLPWMKRDKRDQLMSCVFLNHFYIQGMIISSNATTLTFLRETYCSCPYLAVPSTPFASPSTIRRKVFAIRASDLAFQHLQV